MRKLLIFFLGCLLLTGTRAIAQHFVDTDGSDDNPGTIELPYASFDKAISVAQAGDTIYVRGGVYTLVTTIRITAVKSGSENQLYTLTAYRDEIPLLDFSEQAFGSRGISLAANYWHIKGLLIKGAGDNGMDINFGSNNIIEHCQFFENRDTGLQLSNGSANNKIINCDSYYNADPPDYGDADGFAPKLTVGSGNYFYGCRAWGNCDDGWDGYLRGADDVMTTLENCWTWGNGYLKDGSDPGSQANGNGFKMGGGDNSNSDSLMHHMTLINCVAFSNKNKGFDQNNNLGSMTLYNCSAYNNLTANYRIQRALSPGETLIVKNCLSHAGAVQLGSFAIEEANSWLPPFEVTAGDFLSLDDDQASSPRQSDGNLPEIEFMHLVQGSDLIDGGVDLGFPYKGQAPDLGAFESDYATFIEEIMVVDKFRLLPNYPNPFNPATTISYTLAKPGHVTLVVFNALGQRTAILIDDQVQPAGTHRILWQGRDQSGQRVASGIYFYRITVGNGIVQTRKMQLLK